MKTMNMKAKSAGLAAILALGCALQPAHAQLFGGILNGMTSVVNQVGSKVGARLMDEKPMDIQAERDKFYATLDKQLAGVDAANHEQLRATARAQWSSLETALLLRNAQLQRQKDSPLVDFSQVAREAAGGVSTQLGMNSIFGASSVTDIVGSSALNGLVAGATGTTGTAAVDGRAMRAGMGGAGIGSPAALGAGVSAALSAGVGATVGAVAGSAARQALGSRPAYAFPASLDPRSFLGREPARLLAAELYRENGFVGWKLVDGSPEQGAEAFAPVLGDEHAKAAVFNIDRPSGAVNAAFRVLKVPAADFTQVVEGLEAYLKQKAVYASAGNTLRAVWEDGSFVSADASRVCVGWSAQAAGLYRGAAARNAQAAR